MLVNLIENPTKPQNTVDAVAIKATWGGRGNNAVCYQVRDVNGKWHVITKKHNPQIKVTFNRPRWDGQKWSDGWHSVGRTLESDEMPL
jgi:hypothetical protein